MSTRRTYLGLSQIVSCSAAFGVPGNLAVEADREISYSILSIQMIKKNWIAAYSPGVSLNIFPIPKRPREIHFHNE
ncbi:hypothetical protein BDV28DRAFT_50381 [Aspergillus coremiiformis]|uniref:Uncharacterized protein n=1 Tax=Aspergillus coremiiformis TaxID=138285 RepID=A0A5N6YX13_9EURO|nr:hypothetical protein BDV28DRAFT_50381 [Aspergillus coremiiformis]